MKIDELVATLKAAPSQGGVPVVDMETQALREMSLLFGERDPLRVTDARLLALAERLRLVQLVLDGVRPNNGLWDVVLALPAVRDGQGWF